jgi:hypothetical protein
MDAPLAVWLSATSEEEGVQSRLEPLFRFQVHEDTNGGFEVSDSLVATALDRPLIPRARVSMK